MDRGIVSLYPAAAAVSRESMHPRENSFETSSRGSPGPIFSSAISRPAITVEIEWKANCTEPFRALPAAAAKNIWRGVYLLRQKEHGYGRSVNT